MLRLLVRPRAAPVKSSSGLSGSGRADDRPEGSRRTAFVGTPATAYDADGLPTHAFLEASKRHIAIEPPIQRVQSGWAWIRSGGGSDDRGLTTDSGWGCMLRTGQSLLANGLIHHHLGRGAPLLSCAQHHLA